MENNEIKETKETVAAPADDKKTAAFKKLVEKGKAAGHLTAQEIDNLIVELDLDVDELEKAFDAFHNSDKPFAIIMKTVKGKGVSYMENAVGWHGKAPNTEEYEIAMAELNEALAELEA